MANTKLFEKLAADAGFDVTDQGVWTYGEDGTVPELEKFMELVVRECMSVAGQMRDPLSLNYKPSEKTVEFIRMHFGVYNN